MLKAFKTEIAPTEGQKTKIIRSIGVARFLYNQYIAYNLRLYKMYQRGILDEKQKRFVTANDFDKYVNHNSNFPHRKSSRLLENCIFQKINFSISLQ